MDGPRRRVREVESARGKADDWDGSGQRERQRERERMREEACADGPRPPLRDAEMVALASTGEA